VQPAVTRQDPARRLLVVVVAGEDRGAADEDLAVVGDRRPYLIALITLDEDELAGLSESNDARTRVEEAVERVNGELAHFEQVRRFAILPRDFSAEDNEVTPTMKLKRRIVEDHFADEIEKLYER